MKKTIVLIIAILMTVALCMSGCKKEEETKADPRATIQSAVRSWASVRIMVSSQSIGGASLKSVSYCNVATYNISDGRFTASGKITMIDVYGNSHTGTFDAQGTYDEAQDSATCTHITYGSFK